MKSNLSGLFVLLVSGMVLLAAEKQPAGSVPTAKAAVVQGNNQFAFDFYAQVRDQEGNLFFSPHGISTGLALLYAGAQGPTAQQMSNVLHLSPNREALSAGFAELGAGMSENNDPRSYQLHFANALWTAKGQPVLADYLRTAKLGFQAGLYSVDFAGAPERARQSINSWVAERTQDKIPDLIKPGALHPRTSLVLTNALYFKAPWASPFKKERTREAPFLQEDGRKVMVPLMSQTRELKFLDEGTFQTLELPYAGGDFAMVMFLPKRGTSLAVFEKQFTAERMTSALARLTKQKVNVWLPRFHMTVQADLKPVLAEMGMLLAFSNQADFSGITGSKDLTLSLVIHKAALDVDEQGTEAAAATGMVVIAKGFSAVPTFRADHPFVFAIRDTRSDAILFLGRLSTLKN